VSKILALAAVVPGKEAVPRVSTAAHIPTKDIKATFGEGVREAQ
jgi:hypothetical protein